MRLLFILLAMLIAAPAAAQWRHASTAHFEIYGPGDEASLREAAIRLEKFDYVLRALTGATAAPTKIKVKVYLLRNPAAVQETMPGGGGEGVYGYYNASPRGPFNVNTLRSPSQGAIGSRTGFYDLPGNVGQTVLLHEYAHHFMFQYFPGNYPSWYSEGFAEFVSSIAFLDNDVVEVGHVQQLRSRSLDEGTWLPVYRLLTARSYSDVGSNVPMLYAQGWLLTHYLFSQPEGGEQLRRYLRMIGSGKSYQEAADAVWGAGARELDAALRRYAEIPIRVMRLPFRRIEVGPIAIRELRPAEQALIISDIRIGAGILQSDISDFAAGVRRAAGRFPDDPNALRIQAETDSLSGNHDGAIRAAERLLTVQPNDPKGVMLRANAQLEKVRAANQASAGAYDSAREQLLEANRRAPRDPEILLSYYRTYLWQRQLAPPAAQNALVRALEIVPQDDTIRYLVAVDFEARDMIEDAIRTLRPIASSAHKSDDDPRERARQQRLRQRYRLAGQTLTETPREMLLRLERRLAASSGASAPPAARNEATPPGSR